MLTWISVQPIVVMISQKCDIFSIMQPSHNSLIYDIINSVFNSVSMTAIMITMMILITISLLTTSPCILFLPPISDFLIWCLRKFHILLFFTFPSWKFSSASWPAGRDDFFPLAQVVLYLPRSPQILKNSNESLIPDDDTRSVNNCLPTESFQSSLSSSLWPRRITEKELRAIMPFFITTRVL